VKRTKATSESGFCPLGKLPVEGCQSGCGGGVAAFAQSCQRQQSKNSEHHARCLHHAVRWEWHDRNPITHVRQSAKRKNIPTVLTLLQVEELLLYLEEPTHTAVLVDVMTGLRVGELLALKWQDIDFEKFEISVTRSISLQHVGECKTEASRKPVPLDSRLAEALWRWRNLAHIRALRTGSLPALIQTECNRTGRERSTLASATGSQGGRHRGPDWLAYFPAHVRHSPESEWGRCQNCAGIIAARKQLGDDESLRAGHHGCEA